jgi:hypothetical protein
MEIGPMRVPAIAGRKREPDVAEATNVASVERKDAPRL